MSDPEVKDVPVEDELKGIRVMSDTWLGIAFCLLLGTYALLGPFKPPQHHQHLPFPNCTLTNTTEENILMLQQLLIPISIENFEMRYENLTTWAASLRAEYDQVYYNLTHWQKDRYPLEIVDQLRANSTNLRLKMNMLRNETSYVRNTIKRLKQLQSTTEKVLDQQKAWQGPTKYFLSCEVNDLTKNSTEGNSKYSKKLFNVALAVPSAISGVCAPFCMVLLFIRIIWNENRTALLIITVASQNAVFALLAAVTVRCWLLEHSRDSMIAAVASTVFLVLATATSVIWQLNLGSTIKNWWARKWARMIECLNFGLLVHH